MASLTSVSTDNKAGKEVPLQLLDSLCRGPVEGLLREHQHFPCYELRVSISARGWLHRNLKCCVCVCVLTAHVKLLHLGDQKPHK